MIFLINSRACQKAEEMRASERCGKEGLELDTGLKIERGREEGTYCAKMSPTKARISVPTSSTAKIRQYN